MKNFSFRENLILYIPLVNVLVIIVNHFLEGSVFHFGIFRTIYMLIVIMIFLYVYRILWVNIILYIFLLYLLLLVFFSSNIIGSGEFYLKVFVSFMMYPVAYRFANSQKRYFSLIKMNYLIAILAIGAFFYSQLFGVGTTVYGDETSLLLGGNEGVYIANIIAYSGIIIMYSLSMRHTGDNFLYSNRAKIFVLMISTVVVLLIFRRSAILALFAGLLAYYVLSNRKYLYTKYLIGISILLIIAMPFYIDNLIRVAELRSLEEVLNPQFGRMQDIIFSIEYITSLGLLNSITGIELFNYVEHHSSTRTLHSDFAQIIHGSGFLGIILFFGVFISIYYNALKNKISFFRSNEKQNLYSLIVGLLVACLLISSANQLWVITSFSYVMFYLGAVQGYLRFLNRKKMRKKYA